MSKGTLWMGDIEPYMDEAFLKQAFAVMGETCLSTKIITNKLTGLPLGYGFLEFIDEPTAQRILLKCDGKTIPGSSPSKKFKLNHACHSKDTAQQQIEHSAFVGNLTPEVDDLNLYTAFHSRFPSVKAAKVVLDESGKSRGYGFVRFGNQEEHQQALEVMNGFEGLGGKALRVSSATPKRSNVPTTVSMATPPGQQTYQQYYGNYGYNYQNYYNPWQGYQQYYAGYQGYQGYPGYYGQQPEYPQHTDSSAVAHTGYEDAANAAAAAVPHGPNPPLPQAAATTSESDNEVEDHDMGMPDIEASNKLLLARSEDLYSAFESSRWLPTEGLDPPLVSVK
ncbi:tRNA selenocysteine 1-associated protein 1-like [Dermacentor albipictus]|uniref:tRNA selenocysteine 1-associated protein 1-like n=1 Tax=Dermacentor albipictus TaxID=60249 RepID=UPI0031FC2F30